MGASEQSMANGGTVHPLEEVITLSRDGMTAGIAAGLGGRIVSLRDRAGHEYLAQSPLARPRGLPLSAGYLEGGLGGIDDCLPAIAPGPYPTGKWAGWPIPDHGELWQRAWRVVDQSESTLVLAIEGSHLPYALARTARLLNGGLRTEYRLQNHGDEPLSLVWAAHALLAPSPGAQINIGAHAEVAVDGACSSGIEPYSRIHYPDTAANETLIDLSRWDSLPAGFFVKVFAPLRSGEPVALHHPTWGTTLEIVTVADTPLHIGLWLNKGGIPLPGPVQHLALEPTFGSADALDRALLDDSALWIAAGKTASWMVDYRIKVRTSAH